MAWELNIGILPLRPLRRLHDAALMHMRRSPLALRLLLGLEPTHYRLELWDYTTLLLARAVRPMLRPGQRVWDLGCGPGAVLGRYVCRLEDVEVVSSDVEQACAVEALRTLAGRGLPVTVMRSDLGEAVAGRFDLVLFNAPYLPLADPQRLPTSRPVSGPEAARYLRRFGGGADGMATIGRFLEEVGARLTPGGLALLGFNRVYLPSERVHARAEAAGLRVRAEVASWWNPSLVLVLENAS